MDRLSVGDEVVVKVTVKGDAACDYVMVESPIPAGCEVIPGSGEGTFARFEALYDRAIFYLDSTGTEPASMHFRMRATFAGDFESPAPTACAMYDESQAGAGKTSRTKIAR